MKGAMRAVCAGLSVSVSACPVMAQLATQPSLSTGSAQVAPGDSAGLRAWRISPLISVAETYSDNVALAPANLAKRDWATTVTPGIHAEGSGGRVRGVFDYRLRSTTYANESQLNNRQNFLNSRLTAELIEDRFFLETRGSISQQLRSAFSAAASDTSVASSNRVETSVYQISPYWRGQISDIAQFRVRLNLTQSTSRGLASSSTTTTEWVGGIRNASPSAKIGWALDGTDLMVNTGVATKSQISRVRGSMVLEVLPDLHASVFEGLEATDFPGLSRRSATTPGFGISWAPSNRTQLAVIREKRVFGNAQTVLLAHRTPRIAFRYDDTREIAVASNLIAATGPGSLNALMADLLAANIPDPSQRAQAVNSRLDSQGQGAQGTAQGDFATNQIFVRRNRQMSVAAIGPRDTVTLRWGMRDQIAVGSVSSSLDSFAVSPSIRQQTIDASWMHRLSPQTSATLSVTRLNAKGLAGSAAQSSQTILNLLGTRQIGQKTFVSVGARRSNFDSSVSGSSRENAILTTLTMRF